MYVQRQFLNSLRLIADYLSLIAVFVFTSIVVTRGLTFNTDKHLLLFALLFGVWYISSKTTGLYNDFRSRNYSFELIILIKNVFIQMLVSITVLFLLKHEPVSRTFVFTYGIGLFLLLGLQKYVFRQVLYLLRKKGRNLRHILIVGAGEVGKNFYDVIISNPQFGYNVVGFLDNIKYSYLNGEYLGPIRKLESVLQERKIDNVIITLPHDQMNMVESIVNICDQNTTRAVIIPDYFNLVSNKYSVTMFGKFPVINVREDKLNEVHWRFLKRTFDIFFSSIIIVTVFSWLFPLIAIAIKLNSRGPVFFKQERWGRNNKKFFAYKFRSMVTDCTDVDNNGKYCQAKKDDPRITKVGKILRKTNLDEMPQFFNVLFGDMSIVGPRPHPTPLNVETKDKVNLYMVRHLVKPGITGWAQVNGYRGETKELSLMQKRIGYDLWYIENWSFWFDIQIIFLTLWRMLIGDPNAY